MPRPEVASGPCGNADTIFSQRFAPREMSRASRAASARSWSWLNMIATSSSAFRAMRTTSSPSRRSTPFSRSARAGGGRPEGMRRRRATSAGRVARRRYPIFGRLSFVRRGDGTNPSRMTTRGEFAKSHADRPAFLPIPPARRPRDNGRGHHRPPGDWGDGRRRRLPGLVEVDIFSALDWWLRPGADVVRVTNEPFRVFV